MNAIEFYEKQSSDLNFLKFLSMYLDNLREKDNQTQIKHA